jgi:hypothetical protein
MSVPCIGTEGPAPEPEDVTYSFKPSLMGAPQEFRVGADALYWQAGRYEGRIPYRTIKAIRLSFRPMTMQTQRFVTEIWAESAPKLTVSSASVRGAVDMQRQDAPYAAFVRALHRQMTARGAKPQLLAGSSRYVYWPGVVLFGLLGPAIVVMLVRSVQAGAAAGAAILGVVMLYFFYQMATFFWRNWPSAYDAAVLPERVLPRS